MGLFLFFNILSLNRKAYFKSGDFANFTHLYFGPLQAFYVKKKTIHFQNILLTTKYNIIYKYCLRIKSYNKTPIIFWLKCVLRAAVAKHS